MEELETLNYNLDRCPRQKQIVLFVMKYPGTTESEILLNVYGCDRKRGDNNKAGADAVRRALKNDFIKRLPHMGVYRYFVALQDARDYIRVDHFRYNKV